MAMELLALGGQVLGGFLGRSGARQQNQLQMQLADKQMNFQRQMSSTAFQRAANDLERAGLNRILALGKPASTPSGAMAPVVNEKATMAQAAMNSARTMAEVKNINANTKLTESKIGMMDPMLQIANEFSNGIESIIKYLKKGNEGKGVVDWLQEKIGEIKPIGFDDYDPNNISTSDLRKAKAERLAREQIDILMKTDIPKISQEQLVNSSNRFIKLANGKWFDIIKKIETEIKTGK